MPDTQEHSHLLYEDLVTRAEAQRDKKEAPHISALAPILNLAFSHLNHLSIEYQEDLDEPFLIEIDKPGKFRSLRYKVADIFEGNKPVATETFTRGIFRTYDRDINAVVYHVTREEKLPVFDIHVSFGNTFNVVSDLPRLIREVQRVHNEKMKEFGQENEPMVFINTSKKLAEYWRFMGENIEGFTSDHTTEIETMVDNGNPIGSELILPTLETYTRLCSLIAEGFDEGANDEDSQLAQDVDSSALFDLEWEKVYRNLSDILVLIKRKIRKGNGSESRFEIKELISRFIRSIINTTQKDILDKLNTQSREVFFHHCEAELFRKAGLSKLVERIPKDENIGDVSLMSRMNYITEWINENFPQNQQELDDLGDNLRANKDQINQAFDENNIQKANELIEKRVEMQKLLAVKICTILYSEKFFLYTEGRYSFSNAIDLKEVNCMVFSELIHLLWHKYCGEESMAVLVPGHIFSLVELADGTQLKLDVFPSGYDQLDPSNERIYDIGSHSRLYQAALFSWKAGEVNSSDEAEELYREAIRLSPSTPSFKYNLAGLLEKDPERLIESGAMYIEAVALYPNYPWFMTGLAQFYHYHSTEWGKALALYEQSLKIMEDKPNLPNFLQKDELERRIFELSNLHY